MLPVGKQKIVFADPAIITDIRADCMFGFGRIFRAQRLLPEEFERGSGMISRQIFAFRVGPLVFGGTVDRDGPRCDQRDQFVLIERQLLRMRVKARKGTVRRQRAASVRN